ncbi:non-ribosomal peptide synthetase, partial [Pyxidicoccus caerfyrddinensis]|uniref:non-ribosomal peptide synthetase n=1 Tax=Pyxidicoccus caerfyrddinensis TaxID=2709663 RepID=UPI0013D99ADE
CMERGVDMVVAVLAILKAGGAYVPMDPAYPRERLAFMLQDCGARLALTQLHLSERMEGSGVEALYLDDVAVREQLSRESEANPPHVTSPQHLAYVIYTSGSTGKPKGVMVQHASVMNLRAALASAVYAGAEGALRVSLNAPLSFDASVQQLIQVAEGHALCVVPQAAREDVALLKSWVEKYGVDALDCSPSHLRLLLEEGLGSSRPLRVLVGGEAVDEALWAKLSAHPFIRGFNVYGPTECTVDTTARAVHGAPGRPTLGGPLANVQVYVLDERMQPVPTGVPGELFIGGAGVARGYLHRPELTAEKFVPDAFGTTPGGRLYRTGDKARWLAHGELEYLGRIDFQVKLRGLRIELGEIETALEEVAGVRRAVVLAREDVPGNQRLVAYVVGGAEASEGVLREALKARLPQYMVPSAFVALETMPLTSNGKVDRRALPAPESSASASEYVAPRTPTEEILASLWAALLRVEKVSAQDDFFALGGHSLLATQVVSRVRSSLGVELPLRALFEAPTVAALAARIDSARESAQGLVAPAIVPVPRTGPLPLSFAQQRLWFIDQLEPGGSSYSIPRFIRMQGSLDVGALRLSFEELVRRHEALRTTFLQQEGQPLQLISSHAELSLPVVDLSAMEPEAAREELQRRLREDTLRPFDLATGPLVRASMWKLGPAEHVLSLNLHHIVSDGWSMGVLVRELVSFYGAFSSGQSPQLPPLPIQYADFASWQRDWLQGAVLQGQLDYWKQQLSGAPALLELPTDRPRPAVQSQRGALLPVHLPLPLSEALSAFCQREGVTPFMALLAVWQLLLARYSGQDDVTVGSPIAGRTRGETEGLIGFFVNTLVLRSHVQPQATFRELLAHVRASTLAAYEHQHLPFEKLVEELQPQRSLSHSPLFQVMLVLNNAPPAELSLAGLSFVPLEREAEATKFDLTLSLTQTPRGLSGSLSYRTDLFDASTVSRMVEHLQTLLEATLASPGARVGELPLLSPSERTRLLESFNATTELLSSEEPLHTLIAEQAARHPERPALACEGQVLTYGELDARANQLAWHLRALGVGPESCVALCLERSVEMVVALLAVWKAGGAYVPLDPAQPALRLQALVEEVSAPVVVTVSAFAASFVASHVSAVLLDEDSRLLTGLSTEAPPRQVHPENVAYVLFTSGSTGRPKGVAVSHGQLAHYVHSATQRLDLKDCESFALVSTFVADLGNTVLFPALCTGGLLHVLPQEIASSPAAVAEYFQRHAVDCMKLVPSHLAALMTAAEPRHVLPRKKLVLGGESSSWALMEQVRALAPDCEVFNHYGPTETTVGVLAGRVELPTAGSAPATVPLGRPLAHTRLYVLDERLQPVPVGVPGELFIGGAQVTRGYLRRPELTAERYLPDLYSPVPGARMYRSGDKVRWLADGRVEFIGRADFQVKVRGFRVEPGEIATVLREHPAVHEALVVAREEVPGDKRLVAYVVPSSEPVPAESLRAFLQQRLPAHMVPSAFVSLEAFPLTPNGKVDRKDLPAPEAPSSPEDAYVAPRTPTEELLAALWAEVLRVPRVGVNDHFFELGGHSLLATRLVSRIRAAFRTELPLRTIFEAPTLEALARRIDAQGTADSAPPLVPVSRTGRLPLSFAQQRLWLIDQLEPGSPAYNIPSALRISGALDTEALRQSLEALVRRHEALRTTFRDEAGEPVQVISPPEPLRLDVVNLGNLPEGAREAEARRLAAAEAMTPFDLATGPLLRASLLVLDAREHVLLLTVHHIVSDGWSTGVLVRELVSFYKASASGQSPRLAALPLQYADFAAWQRAWLQGDVLQRQLDYWKQQLSGAPALLELPTDRPRPAVQSQRGTTLPVHLPESVASALSALCQREGVTPFMALLAVWQVLLARYSGQDDVVVGTPIAGRTRSETEGLLGFFVNTLVLRTQLRPRATFRELLAQVRATTLSAYEHQHVPFEKLVEELQPQRSLGHSPLFQVMLVLQNAPGTALSLPGLTFQALEREAEVTKFDLTLALAQTPRGLTGTLSYRTDLFDASTVARMVEHLRTLLDGALASPDARLEALPLVDAAERHQLLVAWNDTGADAPREASIHALFEAQARLTPDAVALVFGEEQLTYRQLDERANQLAHHLRALHVGPEVLVGLCVERSAQLVVGMLAILKAGGAFLCLDPSLPS